jgi:xylulokinase
MTNCLLGIDVGTTSTKAVLVDPHGRLMAEASLPCILKSPFTNWAEEETGQWWENICRLVPLLLEKAGICASQVSAVGVSGMVPAVILLDKQGKAVRPSIQQNDARAIEEIQLMQEQTDTQDILQRTGSPITQQSVGPKLLWLARHEPSNWQKASTVMGSYDYINYRLTGSISIERNWALESGLYDLKCQDWDDDLLHLAGISRSWLGELHQPFDLIGKVTDEAAQATGLLFGTPVVAGSADHIASALSAGIKENGDLLVKLGGSGDILF